MTQPRIALQLFTVRDALGRDLEGTLKRVAAVGYRAVEPFGLTPDTAALTRRLCDDLGLGIPSVHVPLPTGDAKDAVLEVLAHLRPERVVSGLGKAEFATWDLVERSTHRLTEAHALLVGEGYTFGVHNHWWEYQQVAGRYPYRFLLENLPPDVFFELDVYWMQTGGVDPAATIKEFGNRAPLLHLKDGPTKVGEPMVALGQGEVDIRGIISANRPHTEWLIVELDNCSTDIFEAIDESLRYLKGSAAGDDRADAPAS